MSRQFETVKFDAYDGVKYNLDHRINDHKEKCPQIRVHRTGVQAIIFIPPLEKNIISMLAEYDFDMWLENWRGSIDQGSDQWDPEQVVNNDPATIKKIVEKTGIKKIKGIRVASGHQVNLTFEIADNVVSSHYEKDSPFAFRMELKRSKSSSFKIKIFTNNYCPSQYEPFQQSQSKPVHRRPPQGLLFKAMM